MYLHTAQNIKARFSDAHHLIIESQESQDPKMLSAGIQLMRKAQEDCCRAEGGARLAQDGVGQILGSINFQGCIKAYWLNKANRCYFEILLGAFKPSVEDVTKFAYNNDINTRLVQSLIRHDSGNGWNNYRLKTKEFSDLLGHLGAIGSRAAFARVLDECLRRLHEQSYGSSGKQDTLKVQVLTQLNAFKQPNITKPALPAEILAVITQRPVLILAEHRKYKAGLSGGYLTMDVLQAWLDYCPGNEAVTDVILELAGNSLYKMRDVRQLIWAERLGAAVDINEAGRKLREIATEDERVAALHYLLVSPQVESLSFSSILTKASRGFESAVSVLALSPVFNSPDERVANEDLFAEKAVLLTRYLLEKDRKTAIRIMDTKWLDPKKLMRDHVLRDHLIGTDLGL